MTWWLWLLVIWLTVAFPAAFLFWCIARVAGKADEDWERMLEREGTHGPAA